MDSPKFTINYVKLKPIDWRTLEDSYFSSEEDLKFGYNPFRIDKIQNYNPIYSRFFVLNDTNYDSIGLNHNYHFQSTRLLYDNTNKTTCDKPIFIKYSPLLDPYRFMTGKYAKKTGLDVLPHPFATYESGDITKLRDPNNASYVDNFFSYLASQIAQQHGIVHCLDYYGSFLGIQRMFKVNISDDLEFLQSSNYFLENTNKLFKVNFENSDYLNIGSRSNKLKLNISNTHHNISAVCIECEEIAPSESDNIDVSSSTEMVYEKEKGGSNLHNETSDSSTEVEESENSSLNDDDEEEDCWETEDEDGSECTDDELSHFAYINNFPVQLICLEKGDGTLDELFVNKEIDVKTAASVLFQIIMTLITYQKAFHFTHNDLHTNNIMFSNTDKKFLYYRYNKQVYKVPTYGKIFKIIDFGRSIYKFGGQLFCSDSFANGGDASTQYNTEPYMNENNPRLDPNYSFDLTRLGCSIYDFIIDDDDPETIAGFDELQKTILRWCTSDQGKNVLYKRNGEERYPNFKLYKMIARTCHQHTPEEQLKFPYFNQFLVKKISKDTEIMDIDALPSYV
jgi:hypothetical protein